MLTCGSCIFWQRRPADPMNLGAPNIGECRFMPPAPVVVGRNPQGGPMLISVYPIHQGEFPACAQHQQADERSLLSESRLPWLPTKGGDAT